MWFGIQAGDLAAPGVLTLLTAGLGAVLKLMLDARRDGYTLADERLEDARDERERLNNDLGVLRDRVAALEQRLHDQGIEFDAKMTEQRSLKHGALNDLMKAELLLDTVRRLAVHCTCDALQPVQALLDRREL